MEIKITDANIDNFVQHIIEVFHVERSHIMYVPDYKTQQEIFKKAVQTFSDKSLTKRK